MLLMFDINCISRSIDNLNFVGVVGIVYAKKRLLAWARPVRESWFPLCS